MIQAQFAFPGKIDIPLILTSNDYDSRYIQDHQDKYHYVLHSITEKKVFNKAIGLDGFVPLHLKTLRGFLGSQYADDVLSNLHRWGIIQRDAFYLVGKKSYGYRIAPEWSGKSVLRSVYKEEIWLKKLAKQTEAYQKNQGDGITRKNLGRVGIYLDDALAFIEKKYDVTMDFLRLWEDELSLIMASPRSVHAFIILLSLLLTLTKGAILL